MGRRGVGRLRTSREEQKSGLHDLDFHLNHLFESYPEFSLRNLDVITGHSAHTCDPGTALLMKEGFSEGACHKELLGVPALAP